MREPLRAQVIFLGVPTRRYAEEIPASCQHEQSA